MGDYKVSSFSKNYASRVVAFFSVKRNRSLRLTLEAKGLQLQGSFYWAYLLPPSFKGDNKACVSFNFDNVIFYEFLVTFIILGSRLV